MLNDIIVHGFPYLLSVTTLAVYIMAGHKHRHTWLAGISSEALWLVWIVAAGAWGFLLLNIGLFGIFIYNHFKWLKN